MRERHVDIRGLRLCLCEWGAPDAPLLLILHGWLDQGAAWGRTASALAASGWRVAALEHRGHGRSEHAPAGSTYHFTEYVADVDAFLRLALVGEAPVVLVGHSMGGTVAAQVAAIRPERLRALVLIEGLGPPPVSDADAAAQLRRHLDQLATPPAHSPMPTVADAAARLQRFNPALPDEEAAQLAARVTVSLSEGVFWRWDPMHRARAAVAFDVDRFRLLLAQVTTPTSLLFGAESWYLGLPDLAERIACLPAVRHQLTLPTGHSPHLEDPQQLAAALESVLPSP